MNPGGQAVCLSSTPSEYTPGRNGGEMIMVFRPSKLLFPIALCTLTFFACKPAETTTDTSATTSTTTATTSTSSGTGSFQPVMWTPANLNIPGFNFPEPEAT